MNPLAHYLHYGARAGRGSKGHEADFTVTKPISDTAIECRKRPALHSEVALFVTHSRDGRLKPHVRHYLQSLVREGVAVTLIVAADRGFTEDEPWLYDLLDGLYVRANEGWDFACWAHVLRLNRHLYDAQIIYWLNDSVIGPVNQQAFHVLLERVRHEPAGVVGLTANHERWRHIQSYFLAFKREALESWAFHEFLLGVKSLADKQDVISAYEITLGPRLAASGVSVSALFEAKGEVNPTLHEWKELLDAGLPFLKVQVIARDSKDVDKGHWRGLLRKHGYDMALVDQLLAERENPLIHPAAPVYRRGLLPINNPAQAAFIGPFNYNNGLGVAARGYLSAMMHTGLALNALPITRPFHIHQRVAPSLRSTEFIGVPDVAIVHVNPDAWQALLTPAQIEIIEAARKRIGAFVWESQVLPAYFADRLRGLSAVWVPSRFCESGFEKLGGNLPVHVVPYSVSVKPRQVDRARIDQLKRELGLEVQHRMILYSFDASSYLVRKNPIALIHAFNRAGLASNGWRLVIKTKHLSEAKADGLTLAVAAERCAGTVLVDRSMGVDAARTLMDAADIYASPHASEGFGLTIAEAMARGKPVIASDYGGSTDFLDASCGFPIRCTPWELDRDEGAYPKGTVWGRVDEDQFAETLATMGTLDPEEQAAIGAKARQRIEIQLSPATVAQQIRDSIDSLL
jgi:glycosyltransferase involved in cell wall biosynthesis